MIKIKMFKIQMLKCVYFIIVYREDPEIRSLMQMFKIFLVRLD